MGKMIKVGMADLAACKSPDALTTLGLGSCVGIALYDPTTKISGLAHIMLPDSTKIKNNQNIAKFADTGIEELVKQMVKLGASKPRIVAKIAGGAQMFAFKSTTSQTTDMLQVGARNVEAVKTVLKREGIRLIAEDTGLNYGRTIEFYSESGQLLIKRVGKESRTI